MPLHGVEKKTVETEIGSLNLMSSPCNWKTGIFFLAPMGMVASKPHSEGKKYLPGIFLSLTLLHSFPSLGSLPRLGC